MLDDDDADNLLYAVDKSDSPLQLITDIGALYSTASSHLFRVERSVIVTACLCHARAHTLHTIARPHV